MANSTCKIEGCSRPGDKARGWCGLHYGRWHRTGDTGEAAPRYVSASATVRERLQHTGWTVTDTGCWEWNGIPGLNGYGLIAVGGHVQKYAHRVSWEVHNGRPIPAGRFVCHLCDNRICINPDHLFLGTAQDNNADMRAKGRGAKGERGGMSKLTEADVLDIRSARARGVPGAELAERYGITRGYVYGLSALVRWKHLETASSSAQCSSRMNG